MNAELRDLDLSVVQCQEAYINNAKHPWYQCPWFPRGRRSSPVLTKPTRRLIEALMYIVAAGSDTALDDDKLNALWPRFSEVRELTYPCFQLGDGTHLSLGDSFPLASNIVNATTPKDAAKHAADFLKLIMSRIPKDMNELAEDGGATGDAPAAAQSTGESLTPHRAVTAAQAQSSPPADAPIAKDRVWLSVNTDTASTAEVGVPSLLDKPPIPLLLSCHSRVFCHWIYTVVSHSVLVDASCVVPNNALTICWADRNPQQPRCHRCTECSDSGAA